MIRYKVRYSTDFGGVDTILNESELVDFIYRFKVLSIEGFLTQDKTDTEILIKKKT